MDTIVIIGAGLSGLLMAYNIKKNSDAQVIIFEKGKKFEDRMETEERDLACGEGGAGTIFGGKMCFPPASSGVWIRSGFVKSQFEGFKTKCLEPFISNKEFSRNISTEIFVQNEMFVKNYDSVLLKKTEMQMFVSNLIKEVKQRGVIIHYNCEFLSYEKNAEGYIVNCLYAGKEEIANKCNYLVLASGRLSSDSILKWFGKSKSVILQNPDLGIRFSMEYRDTGIFKNMGEDVKIKANFGEIGVRTFCVCSGGENAVVNLNGMRYYDGHFEDEMTEEINLGILARSPYIYGYEGASLYCSCLKDYINSELSLGDFVRHSDTLIRETNVFSDIMHSLRSFVYLLQRNHIIDENLDKYPVWLPSVDRLNPIIKTNQYFETANRNLYTIGDVTGISRGFVQSMWSAYCASNNIIMKLECQKQGEKVRVC